MKFFYRNSKTFFKNTSMQFEKNEKCYMWEKSYYTA